MLARKNQLQSHKQTTASLTMEKSRLNQARTLAIRRNDLKELAEIDEKLVVLIADLAERNRGKDDGRSDDVLAKVNERNRKANSEAIRNAELREAERKRRDRKLMAAGGSGTATPTSLANFDPSARLKTIPKVFNSRSVSISFFCRLCVFSLFSFFHWHPSS